ncbi:MAG: tRNA (adenosine(37)-N6)-threonylcarbamoyltransferase complex dimerization subunit type 1 TsaB [Pyrinomonadaceae bacterium]
MSAEPNMGNPKFILAIEAAIRGGSVSLLKGNTEIAAWKGLTDVSRAEDLLLNISRLCEQSGLDKRKIEAVAVSNGPGSFTGIRIGLATALGLKNALNIPSLGVSLLAAVAAIYDTKETLAIAVPVGRKDVCWQCFNGKNATSPPQNGNIDIFIEFKKNSPHIAFYVQPDLFDVLQGNWKSESRAIPIDVNLSHAVGMAVLDPDFRSDLNPFYVENSRSTLGGHN